MGIRYCIVKNKSTLEKAKNSLTLWWTLIGIISLAVGAWLDVIANESSYKTLLSIISVILITIGGIVFSAEIGSFLADVTGLTEVIKNQLSEIMCNWAFIKRIKPSHLQDLKKQINEELYSKEIAYNEDSLLNFVYKSIEPHIEKYYFEQYSLNIFFRVNEDCLEKTVERKIHIKPATPNKDQKIDISELFSMSIDADFADSYKPELRDIRINGNDERKYFEVKRKEITKDRHYIYKLVSDNQNNIVTLPSKGIDISITFNIRSSKSDSIFTHRLPVACKKYNTEFIFRPEECDVKATAFGFMYNNCSDINTTCIDDTVPGRIKITYSDWVLPSDGVVYTWKYL